jgi:hypothetical protein
MHAVLSPSHAHSDCLTDRWGYNPINHQHLKATTYILVLAFPYGLDNRGSIPGRRSDFYLVIA